MKKVVLPFLLIAACYGAYAIISGMTSGVESAAKSGDFLKVEKEIRLLEEENRNTGGPALEMLRSRLQGWDHRYEVARQENALVITVPTGEQFRATAEKGVRDDGTDGWVWSLMTTE